MQKVLNEKKDSRPLQFSRKNIIRNGHYQRTNVKTTKKLSKMIRKTARLWRLKRNLKVIPVKDL